MANIPAHRLPAEESTALLLPRNAAAHPRNGSTLRHSQSEAAWLLRNGWPISLTIVLQYSANAVSYMCLGRLVSGLPQDLAAASLGGAFAMLTGNSWMLGALSALDTLCSQSYTAGSRNTKLLGLHTQRALVFIAVCFLPVSVLWWNTERIMLRVGQTPELAALTGTYVRCLILQAPGSLVFDTIRRFLQGQGDMRTGARIASITGPFGALLSFFLILVCRDHIGFIGAPIASAISSWAGAGLILVHAHKLPTWTRWSRAVFTGWRPFIKLALPGILMACSELWVFELLTIAASYFGPVAVAAQAITFQSALIGIMIFIGISLATANRIGNLLGGDKPSLARISAWTAIVITALLAFLNGAVIIALRHQWGYIYNKDEAVVSLVAKLLPVAAFFQFCSVISMVCGGVLRGQGRQLYGAAIRLFCIYIIGFPLAYALAFKLNMRMAGLWTAFFLAIMLTTFLEGLTIALTDWSKVARVSRDRVRREEQQMVANDGTSRLVQNPRMDISRANNSTDDHEECASKRIDGLVAPGQPATYGSRTRTVDDSAVDAAFIV
ncbi:mate-domain-containing protein [Thamnocephalis sphaerospora]|uniref:Mate-domain-containing protein n=1 Tax=Thamnocephalis sphaerospora TaxID=78915 RepID=A0A4P9XXG2_9FUNG|nr:mate-domain-containing protein [Thamnocephalis sphaerospora]|eukprot:RKP10722.1 mate-domain-containing protein [Thamnocephalis sphaerospora]